MLQPLLLAEPKIVAAVFDGSGELYDYCWSWETGQVYANRGYTVQAVNDDGYMSISEAQELYDWELRCAVDCFGEGVR